MKSMWVIMVPTMLNDGTPVRKKRHQEWDSRVRSISGGLTVDTPSIGQWVNRDGKLFRERMIPVQVIADAEEMLCIAAIAKEFYNQEAILYYEISRNVQLLQADQIPSSKTLKEKLKRRKNASTG